MTTHEANATEMARVQRVAAPYEASGYQITFAPAPDTLPAFLAGYQPDFVAERDGEHVLVEVRQSAAASDEEHYREIAERVQGHPQWRVDLVVLETSDRLSLGSELPVLSASDVERRYQEAHRLAADGYDEAAVLNDTLWSLYQQRNAIAHGFSAQRTPNSAERVIRAGRELLAEGRRAA